MVEKQENNLASMLNLTVDKIQELVDANSILGDKIQIDGITIIPVSKISVGFAGGGADLTDNVKKKKSTPAGMGGSVTVTPLTFLVIDENGVRIENINAQDAKNSTLAEIVAMILEKIKPAKKDKTNTEQ